MVSAIFDEHHAADDPIAQFDAWWKDAQEAGIVLPGLMTLCTVDASGMPDGRIMLLNRFDAEGFMFFSNYQSAKGQQLADNPMAAIVLYWMALDRQVRIRGDIEKLTAEESDEGFHNLPLPARLMILSSKQSSTIHGTAELQAKYSQMEQAWTEQAPSRPAHWGGYRLIPHVVEFVQGSATGFHDRIQYSIIESDWVKQRLSP